MSEITKLQQEILDLRKALDALAEKLETKMLQVNGSATVTGDITEGGKKLAAKYQPKIEDSVAVVTNDTGNDSTASAILQIVGVNGTAAEPDVPPGARIRIGGGTSPVTTGGFRIDRAGTTLIEVKHNQDLHVKNDLLVAGTLRVGDVEITAEKYQKMEKELVDLKKSIAKLRDDIEKGNIIAKQA